MKKILSIAAVALCMCFTSCKDYLDINVDPNTPSDAYVTTSLIFPAVEMNLAASYGDYLRIVGGYFSQHYSQYFGTSNYLDYSQFTMSGTRCSSTYAQLFQKGLENCDIVLKKADADGDAGTVLAATVLRCFIFEVLVDCFGEVPYSEALDPENLAPAYDDGKAVYAGIISELDAALAKVSPSASVTKNFLFPGQTADAWIRFANALKLRILMRESNVVDVKDQVQALINENKFPVSDVEYANCWSEESGKESPFHAEEISTLGGSTQKNVIANIALVGTMQQGTYLDGRLEKFFKKNKNGQFAGGVSGSNFSKTKLYKSDYWCQPVTSYDMPVSLITVSEIEFFKAEFEARYGSEANAQAAYEKAIEASFESAGAEGAADCISKFPFSKAKYAECIGISKWLALSGVNNFEAYCELRRLGYPAFGPISGDDIYDDVNDDSYDPSVYNPGTLYTPIKVDAKVGKNNCIARWPYAESSSSRNSNIPEFPGFTTPIFWAKK